MTQTATVAVIQREFGEDRDDNRAGIVAAVAEAIDAGADIVLPPELFEGRYFPQHEEQEYFSWATTLHESPAIAAMTGLSSPAEVTMTVSLGLADAAGAPASEVPANAATAAATVTAARPFFCQTSRAR